MDWSYISGFLDADGSVTLVKRKGRVYPKINFHNNDDQLLREIESYIKSGNDVNIQWYRRTPKEDHHNVQYTMSIAYYKNVIPLIGYLDLEHQKKRHRLIIIEYLYDLPAVYNNSEVYRRLILDFYDEKSSSYLMSFVDRKGNVLCYSSNTLSKVS